MLCRGLVSEKNVVTAYICLEYDCWRESEDGIVPDKSVGIITHTR